MLRRHETGILRSCTVTTVWSAALLASACSSRVPSEHTWCRDCEDQTVELLDTRAERSAATDTSGKRTDTTVSDGGTDEDSTERSTTDRDDLSGDGSEDNTTSDEPGHVKEDNNCELPRDQSELQLPLWTLVVEDDAWAQLHDSPYDDIEVPAQVCIDGELLPVGMEIQGASARRREKKNYKLKFNQGMELDGSRFGTERTIDKVIIKAMGTDRSKIREPLAFELWRRMGHHAPREDFLNLQINDRYHGLYVLVEPVDKDYLRRRQIPDWGTLYKGVRKHGSWADFRPGRPLDKAFEDKTNEDAPNFTVLSELVELIQDQRLQGEDFADALGEQLSLSEYIDRMIWVSFTQNIDATAQNFFLYHVERANEPDWQLIPWDSNVSFGEHLRDPEALSAFDSGMQLDGGNLLAERILEVDSLRAHFKNRYLELLDTVFEPENLLEMFEPFARRVRHDMSYDQERWKYPTDAETGLGAVREFLQVRSGYVRKALEKKF